MKCGVALNQQGNLHYDYLAGVPVYNLETVPIEYEVKKISGGKFVQFEYQGPAMLFRQTIRDIYQIWLSKYRIKKISPEVCGYNHIECYDDRFDWEARVSTITLLCPVQE